MKKQPLRPALLVLGTALRELRTTQGMGLRVLARRLGISAADLSAWELGMRRPPAEAAALILGYLRAKPAEYRQLMQLHGQSDRSSYVEDLGPNVTDLQHVYEKQAVRVSEWAPHILPEVLQTAEYRQAILSDGEVELDDIDQEIFERQVGELDRPQGYRHVVLVSEAAWPTSSCLPHTDKVTIRVVPTNACTSEASHGFTIYELVSSTFTVVLRHEHAVIYLGETGTVERYRATFARLQRKALDHTLFRISR